MAVSLCRDRRRCAPFVASPEFDNLVVIAGTFHRLPSEIARPLLPDLSPAQVSATDWYAFDVAAAHRWWQLRTPKDASKDTPKGTPRGEQMPRRRRPDRAETVRTTPDPDLPLELGGVLRGTEIPPWQR